MLTWQREEEREKTPSKVCRSRLKKNFPFLQARANRDKKLAEKGQINPKKRARHSFDQKGTLVPSVK